MIQELFPEAKTVGLLYCSAEANSLYQVNIIKGYLTEMGIRARNMPSPIPTISLPWRSWPRSAT